jgi:hypothetical protein
MRLASCGPDAHLADGVPNSLDVRLEVTFRPIPPGRDENQTSI